jgi:sugar/nucleoside kinase (ribokinase family)
MSSAVDVVCVGLIVADHVCAPIPRLPPSGALVTTSRLELTIGGSAANTAVDLAKLDLAVSIVGRVGDDVLGRFCREALEGQRVDCENLVVSGTSQTSGTLIVNVQGEDRRFIHTVGANAELTGLEVSDELLRRCRALYVGGFILNPALSGENVAELFRRARELGVRTILDVVIGEAEEQNAARMLAPVLPHTDFFLPNGDEARLITGESDSLRQLDGLRQMGARTTILTRGRCGALIAQEGTLHEAAAYPVEQVDGTGGGDAFIAGLIYGLLKSPSAKADIVACIPYGAAMGASCVRSMGATTGVFRRTELEEFVAANPLEIHPVRAGRTFDS